MPRTDALPLLRCDIFCNVIDNFGDAGVCWRLARELADITDWRVRLIIDRPELIGRLAGAPVPDSVEVSDWRDSGKHVADIVIEAFACQIPPDYLDRMRLRSPSPVWINLEYLSAEAWIEDCHSLPSPEPSSGIAKYFYFPGFTAGSGGLIREHRLDALRDDMRHPGYRDTWLAETLGLEKTDDCLVSLFCYPDSPLDALFAEWRRSPRPVHCLLADGLTEPHLQKILANATRSGIRITRLPFMPQDAYDRLLAACDVNFVRGEDSFVRAQWAGKPFVWQAYRQSEGTHLVKLDAFLGRYLAALPPETAQTVGELHSGWNGGARWQEGIWSRFLSKALELAAHNVRWSETLRKHGNLAENLAVFCQSKL